MVKRSRDLKGPVSETISYADEVIVVQSPSALRPVPEKSDMGRGPYRLLELLYRFEKIPAKFLEHVMVFSTLALGFLMALQVLLRYVLKLPFLGIEEMAPLFAVWAYFLGMSFATRHRDHIGGGILTIVFKSPVFIKTVRLIGTTVSFIVVCVFGYYVYNMAIFNMNIGRLSTYMRLPKYLWDFSVVAGCLISGFYLLLQIILESVDLASGSGRWEDEV